MPSELHGKFVWYELVSPDAVASRRFFAEMLGWSVRDSGVPGADYTLMSAAGTDIAGIMAMMEGMQPGWIGYIGTDDIEASVAAARKAGATIIVPVHPIPGVGRFSLLLDPTGAGFALLEYGPDFQKPSFPDKGLQGHVWWRELHTNDRARAHGFYDGQFGWPETGRMPMGPEEFYQIFSYGADGPQRGAIFTDKDAKAPHWLFYIWVDDLDATQAKLEKAGGKVVNGPMEVPGGAWILHALDPQGILFALVGDRAKK